MATRLHSILYSAYHQKKYDDLHQQFINTFETFLQKLKEKIAAKEIVEVPFEKEMEEKADRIRKLHSYTLKPDGLGEVVASPQAVVQQSSAVPETESPSHMAVIRKKRKLAN
ncbi:hypothetical protein ABKN59_010508 [Abortiporus biennis]